MEQKLKIPVLRLLALYESNDNFKFLVTQVECYCECDLRIASVRKNVPGFLTLTSGFIIFILGTGMLIDPAQFAEHIFAIICVLTICIFGIMRDALRSIRLQMQIHEERLAIAEYFKACISMSDLAFFEKSIFEHETIDQNDAVVLCMFFKSVRKIFFLQDHDLKSNYTKPLRNYFFWDSEER